MRASQTVGLDVCSLKHRQRSLSRERTSTFICVCHDHSESTLPESRTNEHRFAISCALDGCDRRRSDVLVGSGTHRKSFSYRFPQLFSSLAGFGVVALSLDDIETKVRWNRDPLRLREEIWFGEEYAANRRILRRLNAGPS